MTTAMTTLDGGDLAAHVRISIRCRAHLFHRYFRR